MSSLRSLGRPVGRLARRGWQGPHVPGWTRSIATTPQSRFAEEEPKKRGFFATLKAEVEKEMEKDEEMKVSACPGAHGSRQAGRGFRAHDTVTQPPEKPGDAEGKVGRPLRDHEEGPRV